MTVCTYCGSHINIHDDHVIAQSKGGVRTVPACAKCNQAKSDKPLMQWLRDMKQNNAYRWNRIEAHNKGKKNEISQKVQKIRDEK